MARIKKEVLSSKVYNSLKEMIADYRFQPGKRVNVERLTRELEVSRTPIWEAVRRLEQEGLLKNIPNRGVFMVEMTLEKALEIFQVRGALERVAGRLAAENVDEKVLDKMNRCLEEQYKAIESGDLVRYSRLDFDFHSMVYKTTQNGFLQEMLDSIKTRMQPFKIELKPILPDLYKGHLQILNALRSKNPDEVERAFIEHNEKVLDQIRKDMEMEAERVRVSKMIRENHLNG
ncbi:MAG: GntR family transcriptional regulator [Thermodesulfobacteriota bacterium]